MVTAVSNTATAVTTTSSVSTSSAKAAALATELAAKQSELANAKTDDEKSKINTEITKLKAEIAALKTSDKQDTQQAAKSGKDGTSVQVTSADKAAPEGRISGAAMDVLMRLSPQGGMMGGPGGPMDVSQIYSQIDTDDDGKVTKDEFVKGRDKHMSEDQASTLFASIDTANSGSITEEQFAKSFQRGGADSGRPMGPPPGGAGQPHGDWNNQAATNSTTTIIA